MDALKRIGEKLAMKGDIKINDLVSISLHKETSCIAVHIMPADELNSTEKLDEIMSGVKQLAKQLKDPKQFPGFNAITLTSWIVTLHDRLIKWLGFDIDFDGKDPRSVPMIIDYYKRRGSIDGETRYLREEHWPIEPLFSSIERDRFVGQFAKDV